MNRALAAALRCLGLVVAWAILAGNAFAQGNYRGSPQGGRSALMGGTGVALGRDGSIPFLNPAGLTRIESGTVSFSTNFFSISHTRYDRFFQPRRDDGSVLGAAQLDGPSYSQTKLDGIPSTLCFYFRLGRLIAGTTDARHMAAACFGTTERSANDGTALQFHRASGPYEVSQTQTFNRSFRRFLIGPTYALRLPNWSIGAALHLVATNYSATTNASNIVSIDSSSYASTLESSFAGNSYDLALRLGASRRFTRNVTLGLSALLPALHLFGGLQATQTTTALAAGGNQSMTSLIGSGNFKAPPPPSISAGLGYESGKLRVESDLFFYFPVGPAFASDLSLTAHTVTQASADKSERTVRIREGANVLIDAAFGIERYVLPSISVLGGFSTDFSANPPLASTPAFGSVLWSRTSRAALSFGVASYGGMGELLVGTELSFAQGKAYAADAFGTPSQLSLVSQTTWSALFVLAGKTSLSEVKSTVEKIRTLTKPL